MEIEYDAVVATGIVEKVNVEPKLDVSRVGAPLVEAGVKSEANAVVAPDAPETETTQETMVPTRAGKVFVQLKLDAIVGVPKTSKFNVPPEIALRPLRRTEMVNEVVVATDVVENVNVEPPLDVAKEVGVAVAEAEKSAITAVVAPEAPETEIVHVIGEPARAGVEQSKDELVVGDP